MWKYLILIVLSCTAGISLVLRDSSVKRAPAALNNGLNCSNILRNITSYKSFKSEMLAREAVVGKEYYLLTDNNEIHRGILKSKSEDYLYFKHGDEEFSIEVNRLDDLAVNIKPKPLIKNISNAISTIVTIETLKGIIFYPKKTILKQGNYHFVGDLIGGATETVKKLADGVNNFDEFMAHANLRVPESIVIVKDKSIFPGLTGPFSTSANIPSFWQLKNRNVIAMRPLLYKTKVTEDAGVLMHERVHSILHASYGVDSFVNRSSLFQEAFADIFSALYRDDPYIGLGALSDGRPLRDLKSAKSASSGHDMTSVLAGVGHGDHDRSMYVSSLLWNIRELTDIEFAKDFAFKTLEALNTHHDSYRSLIKSRGDKFADSYDDLKFFLAVVHKVARDSENYDELMKLLEKRMNINSIDKTFIEELSYKIEPVELDKVLSTDVSNFDKRTVVVTGLASGALAIDGVIMYTLLSSESE